MVRFKRANGGHERDEEAKDGRCPSPPGMTPYWSQDAVGSELRVGEKFRMLAIIATERL